MKDYQNKRAFTITIVISCFIILCSDYGISQTKNNIDQMFIRHIDVDGDGLEDDVNLYLNGEGWDKPLNWILSISTKGQVIFEHKSNDALIDSFFNDNAFVDQKCKSYLECKKKYYLEDLLYYLFIKTDLSQNMHAFDKNNTGSIYYVAKNELMTKYSLTETEANETVEWMIKKIKLNEVNILYIPLTPVLTELPRMFVNRVGKFVTIYEW
ncbi:MAG: hypothetical protein WCZ90_09075 [Melioribacteraceae bacterium]